MGEEVLPDSAGQSIEDTRGAIDDFMSTIPDGIREEGVSKARRKRAAKWILDLTDLLNDALIGGHVIS